MDHHTGSLVRIEWHPERATLRSFGLALALLCLARAAWHWPDNAAALTAIAFTLASAALVCPSVLRMPFVWLGVLSFPLRWSVAFLVLALIYFAVITPVAYAVRVARRLARREAGDTHAESNWHIAPARGDKSSYFRQF